MSLVVTNQYKFQN